MLSAPRAQHGGALRRVDMRAVLDTLLYQNRTGCQWDMLPHDLLPKSTRYVGQDRPPINRLNSSGSKSLSCS